MARGFYMQDGVDGDGQIRLRDRARWGAIVAGLFSAIATLLVLGVLGVAIGLSAEPNTADLSTGAMVWGAAAAIIAFFVGGFVAGRTAGVAGPTNGAMNGLMVGVTAIVVILWFVSSGVGNLLGAAATNLGDIVSLAGQADVDVNAQPVFENAESAAWGTFVALLLALGASALGGLLAFRGGPLDPEVEARRPYGDAEAKRTYDRQPRVREREPEASARLRRDQRVP